MSLLAAKKKKRRKPFNKEWQLHLMILLPMIFLILFSFLPMFVLRLAFVEKLSYKKGIWGSEWAGLKWFKYIFTSLPEFKRAFRNTLFIATSKLVLGFPVPIIISLLLNEMRSKRYKKLIQTLIFLPYFISWVVMGGIIKTIFAHVGAFDKILMFLRFLIVSFVTSLFFFISSL